MKYDRHNAKTHSRATMRGIWAAANTPLPIKARSMKRAFATMSITGSMILALTGFSLPESRASFRDVGGRAQADV